MADVNAKLKAASDKRLASLKPEFRAKVDKLLAAAEDATNLPWICVYGRRTLKEQAELYAQGRTKPGKVVTNAAPGFSAHNYGLAADLAPVKNGAICWDLPNFKKMADQAKKLGLVPGYYFKQIFDGDHVEDATWRECVVSELPALAKAEGVTVPAAKGAA